MTEGAITLTVVSFNMWAESFLKTERTDWVYKHILKEKPDVILFQEVSNSNVLELAKKLRKLDYHYKVANEKRTVYELICSRWPIVDHKFNRYSTSKKGCGLLWADLKIKGNIVTVGSTQLDQDPDEDQKRLGQLDCILKFLANHNHTTIVGCDTGFRKNEGYDLQGTQWKDSWVESGKNKLAQYTYDFNRNKNITERVQTRPDRIYYQGAFKEPYYELLGTLAMCGSAKVNPSDHFGIKLTIQVLIREGY
jgi:hypothetical protein